MFKKSDYVFMFDCDNTLLNNDEFQSDLSCLLETRFGIDGHDRYWRIFGELSDSKGIADYMGALNIFRIDNADNTNVSRLVDFLTNYSFEHLLYPNALDVVQHFQKLGKTIILTDGEETFQSKKLRSSGLWGAVDGNVLIYVHKEKMVEDLEKNYPALHYALVDDKLRILSAMKKTMGAQLTTIFVCQGHYALDVKSNAMYAPADLTVNRIGDLINYRLPDV